MGHFWINSADDISFTENAANDNSRELKKVQCGDAWLYAATNALLKHDMVENEYGILVWQGYIWEKKHPEQFISAKDLLLLLQASPMQAHALISGNYALVYYNKQQDATYIFTDKYNTTPVFYFEENGNYCFGTEYEPMISLMQEKRLNKLSILQYFLYDSVTGDQTLFEGLKRLPAHSITKIQQDKISIDQQKIDGIACNRKLTLEEAASAIVKNIGENLRRIYNTYSREDLTLTVTGGLDSRILLSLTGKEVRAGLKGLTFYGKNLSPDEDSEVIIARKLQQKAGFEHILMPVDIFGKSLGKDYFDFSRNLGLEKQIVLTGTYGGELMTGAYSYAIGNHLSTLLKHVTHWKNRYFNASLKKYDQEKLKLIFNKDFIQQASEPAVYIRGQYYASPHSNKELAFVIGYLSNSFFSNVYNGSMGAWLQPYKNQTDKLNVFLNPELLDLLLSFPETMLNDPAFGLYHAIYSRLLPEFNDVPTNNRTYANMEKSVIPLISEGQEPKNHRVIIEENIVENFANTALLADRGIINPHYLQRIRKSNDVKEIAKAIDLANWIGIYG